MLVKVYQHIKGWFYRIVEEDDEHLLSRGFDIFIILLIIINVIALVLETVDDVFEPYAKIFYKFDIISLYIFSVEYLLRLWVITNNPKYNHPILGRLRYIFSFTALIDLFAILPFYLPSGYISDGRVLRIVRIFRIFRIFKFNRYSKSAELIGNVLRVRKVDLIFSFGIAMLLLLLVSSLMYFVEHNVQPEKFSSIPATLWWGIATLTTVGYGDIVPITALGKFLGGVMAVLGVGIFALPAGILANGFGEEIRKRAEELKRDQQNSKYIDENHCPHCGELLDDKHAHSQK